MSRSPFTPKPRFLITLEAPPGPTAPTPAKAATGKRTRKARVPAEAEPRHVGVSQRPLWSILPSPENDKLYRPVNPDDPAIIALAESIREHGIREPLAITLDDYILSGHRRYAAAKLAGLTMVPCRVENVSREGQPDLFFRLVREMNRQREKTLDEKLREEIVSANPDEAYESMIEHRKRKARVKVEGIELRGESKRCEISTAKIPMLNAAIRVINELRDFWPLSDRRVHYGLLSAPPLRHANKPDSIYANDRQSYGDLCDLLTRARIAGIIPWDAVDDPTRPVTLWDCWQTPQTFVAQELGGFLKGYWRDLQQSQPNHIEIVAEKNTLASVVKPVAGEYCIPLTIGRGYCSSPPRKAMADRYRAGGREKLILLMLADHDPDGDEIAQSFARSMRDDFKVKDVLPIKVALTAEQVQRFNLPAKMRAKKTSAHFQKFHDRHGDNVFELEALEPTDLQTILREAIDRVLDIGAFNAELDAEKRDAAFLETVRRRAALALAGMGNDSDE